MAKLTKEQRERKLKAEIAEYAKRVVADSPPLRPEQLDKLAVLLRGGKVSPGPRQPSAYELEQRRKADELAAAIKHAEQLAASMIECDVCNLSPVAHRAQQGYGVVGFHEWVPGRAQKIIDGAGK